MYFKYPIIDTHIHVGDIEEINKAVKKAEYEQYVLLSGSINPKCVWGNLELLDIKKKAPEKIYAYACLHKTGEGAPEADELLRQVQAYHKVGFDGMKLLFGKPECRKADGVSLCDECYDPMYDFLERNNIPVLLHSNDPVEFWDKERIPKWAMEAGYYCDETYPTHEQIREETIGILKKHPKLNMTIAHIFFLSNADQYDLAEELLETYPNLTFDCARDGQCMKALNGMKDGVSSLKNMPEGLFMEQTFSGQAGKDGSSVCAAVWKQIRFI